MNIRLLKLRNKNIVKKVKCMKTPLEERYFYYSFGSTSAPLGPTDVFHISFWGCYVSVAKLEQVIVVRIEVTHFM